MSNPLKAPFPAAISLLDEGFIVLMTPHASAYVHPFTCDGETLEKELLEYLDRVAYPWRTKCVIVENETELKAAPTRAEFRKGKGKGKGSS